MKIIEVAKNTKFLMLTSALFWLAVLIPVKIESASPLAVISRVEGRVSVSGPDSEGQWRRASAGDFLVEGDRVKTAKKSMAVINFISGIEIEVNEDTEFVIKLSERQGDRREEMDMILGEILSKVRPGADYRVRTPQAVAAVRGTKFGVRASGNMTEVYVFEGMVDVFNDYGKTLCRQGEKTSVTAGSSPSEPEKLPEEDMAEETSWAAEEKEEIDIELELKSEKGFITGEPVEVILKASSEYEGRIDVKTSSEDFELSSDGRKWSGSSRFRMRGGELSFFCRKKMPGPGVLTIDNKDIKTLITAVNFDEPKEKRLRLQLDDGRELELNFKKN